MLTVTNWKNSFRLCGKVKIFDDSFKINERGKNNPDYIYNSMNLSINCGNCGSFYVNLIGGYSSSNPYDIRVKPKDGGEPKFVKWNERLNQDIIKDVSSISFVTAGITEENGKTVFKNFLAPYDLIQYLKDNLFPDTKVIVTGARELSIYNDEIRERLTLRSIHLANGEQEGATFKQSLAINENSFNLKYIDKAKKLIPITGYAFQYQYKLNDGSLFKNYYPYKVTMYFDYSRYSSEQLKKFISVISKHNAENSYNQVNFVGEYRLYGNTKEYEIPKETQELIDAGILNEEDVKHSYVDNNTDFTPFSVITGVEPFNGLICFRDRYTANDMTPSPNTIQTSQATKADTNNNNDKSMEKSADEIIGGDLDDWLDIC